VRFSCPTLQQVSEKRQEEGENIVKCGEKQDNTQPLVGHFNYCLLLCIMEERVGKSSA